MSSVVGAVVAGVLVSVEVSAIALASHRLARWFEPDGDAWDRWLAGLVAGLAGTTVVLTALGAVGLLRPAVVVVALLLASTVVLKVVPDPDAGRERDPQTEGARSPGSHWLGGAVAIAAAAGAGHFIATGMSGSTSSTDSLQYHVPNLGSWLHDGNLWRLPFSLAGYVTNTYPSGFELTGAVLMAPTGSDQLVYLTVVPWVALAVVAVAVTGRRLGADVRAGALMGLAVILTPLVVWTQAGALNSDVAAAAGIVAAIGLLLGRDGPSARTRTAVLAGLALGLATGSKYTAFGAAAAVLLLVTIVPRDRRPRVVMGLVGGSAVLTSLWLVRSLAATGNPLFPLEAGPLEGAISPLTKYDLPLIGHVFARRWDAVRAWWSLARTFYGFALVLPAVALFALVRSTTREVRVVAVITIVAGVAYVCTPYTGGGSDAVEFLIGSQLRYALPLVLLAAAVGVGILGRWAAPAAGALLLWDAWRLIDGTGNRPEVNVHVATVLWSGALLVLVAVWMGLPAARQRVMQLPRLQLVAGAAAVLGLVAAGALLVQGDRPRTEVARLLAAEGHPAGPVAVVYVANVRSLQDDDFAVELVKANAGGVDDEAPELDPAELDRKLLALDAVVLAVDRTRGPTVPAGWSPSSDWRLAASQGLTDLYVRNR
jgi:hypothetical protein